MNPLSKLTEKKIRGQIESDRELRRQATPGSWSVTHGFIYAWENGKASVDIALLDLPRGMRGDPTKTLANARFILNATKMLEERDKTIEMLLDHIASLEEGRDFSVA
jgi:hypothetical protein